ncbi:DUF6894 family protein [Bradyrhizobium sp. URHC0002]|jgi:hypothetical protein
MNPVAIPRYYFAVRGDQIAPDEEGMEAAQAGAARTLADMARNAIRGAARRQRDRISIDVRDDDGPVLQVTFTFEVHQHRD